MKKWKLFLGILIIVLVIMSLVIFEQTKNNGERLSEMEVVELLKQKYDTAIKLYDMSEEYFDKEEVNEIIDGRQYQCYKITNYDIVLKNNFSEKMFNDFENKAVCLMIINEIPYMVDGGMGFSTYVGVEEFKDITITNNKITAIVKTKHNDVEGNFIGYKESVFAISKSGNNWIIDQFNFDDISNSNIDF